MQAFGNRFGRGRLLVAVAAAGTLLTGIQGCRSSQQPTVAAVDNNGPDPADANMAPVSAVSDGSQQSVYATYPPAPGSRRLLTSPNGRVLDARASGPNQQAVQDYPENAAPIERREPQAANQSYSGDLQDPNYGAQAAPGQDQSTWSAGEQDAYNQVTEEADTAPPPLPVYEQPPAPAPNYLWTPGYWNYAPAGYFWVPGAWVAAPYQGALWTPGYWGAWNHRYGYHPGYWGRYVGFYGGISYGFGYFGSGYHGGYWRGNDFYYNQAVNRVNTVNIRNVYNRSVVINNNTVINNTIVNNRNVTVNRISYNGGTGGIQARPSRSDVAAFQSPRVAPMTAQVQNQRLAAENREQFFKQNGGRPVMAAVSKPFAADHVAAPTPQRQEPGAVRVEPGLAAQQAARPGQPQLRPGRPAVQGQAVGQAQQPGLLQQRDLAQRASEQQRDLAQQRAVQTGALQQQRSGGGVSAQEQQRAFQQQQQQHEQQLQQRGQAQANQPGAPPVRNAPALRPTPATPTSQGVAVGRQQQAVQDRRASDARQQAQQQQAQQQQQQLQQQQVQRQQAQQQRQAQENAAAAAQQQQQRQLEQQRSQAAQGQRAAQPAPQPRPTENPAAGQQERSAEQQQRSQFEQQRSQQIQQQRAAPQIQQQRPAPAEPQHFQSQQPRAVPQGQPHAPAPPRTESHPAPQSEHKDGGHQH